MDEIELQEKSIDNNIMDGDSLFGLLQNYLDFINNDEYVIAEVKAPSNTYTYNCNYDFKVDIKAKQLQEEGYISNCKIAITTNSWININQTITMYINI